MLKIGFSTKFFTLWNITKEVMYTTNLRGEHHPSHEKINYTYIQNLSMDEEQAILKAKEHGATNLEVDTDLYGRNSSFFKEVKLFSELPKDINPFFTFGRHCDEDILSCQDISYLHWYFKETGNRYAKKVLIANGYIEHDGKVYNDTEYADILANEQKEKERESLIAKLSNGEYMNLTFTLLHNPNDEGAAATNLPLDIKFDQVKALYYRDFEYFLPVIDGKGKKLKGKEITAMVKLTEYHGFPILQFIKLI